MAVQGLQQAAVELLLIPDLAKSKSASRLQKLLKQPKGLEEVYAQWDNAFSDVRALKSAAVDNVLRSKADELKAAANKLLNSNPKDAQQLYTAAILLTPENHLLFSNRSAAFMKLELYQKALEDAYKVIGLEPSWPKGYLRQGNALEAIPRLEEAKKAYANAEGLEPGSATEDVLRVNGKIEAEEFNIHGESALGKSKAAEAENWFNQALERDPGNYLYYSNRSEARARLGKKAEALHDMNQAVRIRKDWTRGWAKLGERAQEAEEYERAAQVFNYVATLDVPNAASWQTKAANMVQEDVKARLLKQAMAGKN